MDIQALKDEYKRLEAESVYVMKNPPPEGYVAGLYRIQEITNRQIQIMDALPESEQSLLQREIDERALESSDHD